MILVGRGVARGEGGERRGGSRDVMRGRVFKNMCVYIVDGENGWVKDTKYMPSQVSLQSLTKGFTNASLLETTTGAYLAATKRRTLREPLMRASVGASVKTFSVQRRFFSFAHRRFAVVIGSVASALSLWAFSLIW